MELSGHQSDLKDKGITVFVVTYDSREDNNKFHDKHSIRFPILSDTGSAFFYELGLVNESLKGKGKYYGVPYPGIVFIDGNGVVKSKLAETNYRERPAMEVVLEHVENLITR